MLSSKKIILIISVLALLIMPLAACGFSPLYRTANYQEVANVLKNIKISNIPNRDGQILRNYLIDSFYTKGIPSSNPKYRLDIYGLQETVTALGIQKDATATRSQMRIQVNVKLVDPNADNKILLERQLRSVSSFNILDSQYATRVSQQNVKERSLRDLSEQITREISLYFKNKARQVH